MSSRELFITWSDYRYGDTNKSFFEEREKIPFTMIPEVISHVMDKIQFFPVKELDIIFEADYLSRKVAKDYLKL